MSAVFVHNSRLQSAAMLLEFRIPLPYCVEDPNVGYLFMNMEACKQATGGGEGVEWLVEEEYRCSFPVPCRYDNTDGHMTCDVPGYSPPKNKGIYTLKQ